MENLYRIEPIDISESFGASVLPSGAVGYHKRIQIMPVGEPLITDKRKFRFSPDDLLAVQKDLAARKNTIPVLYTHGDGPRDEEAAGWVDSFEVTDRGLFGFVVWNAEAADAIKAGKWKYLSPGFMGFSDDDGFVHPRRLLEVSLTNIPAIDGMDPVTASARGAKVADGPHTPAHEGSNPSPATTLEANPEQEVPEMKFSVETLGLLGLAENASVEEIETTLKATLSAMPKCPDCGKTMKCSCKDKASAEVEVKAEAAPAPEPEPVLIVRSEDEIKAEVEAAVRAEYEAKERAAKVDSLIARAEAEGKLSADNREGFRAAAEKDLDAATVLLAQMSAVAPVARTVSSKPVHVKAYTSESERLTAIFQKVARTGLSVNEAKRALDAN